MNEATKTCRDCLYFDTLIPGASEGTCFLNIFNVDEVIIVNHNHTCDELSDGEDAL